MPFRIEISDLAEEELKAIRAFDRRIIVDALWPQLSHQPAVVTRNRKRLDAAAPQFEHVPPIWELRVGEFRVFNDVEEINEVVYARAVRHKQPRQTTEDVIS